MKIARTLLGIFALISLCCADYVSIICTTPVGQNYFVAGNSYNCNAKYNGQNDGGSVLTAAANSNYTINPSSISVPSNTNTQFTLQFAHSGITVPWVLNPPVAGVSITNSPNAPSFARGTVSFSSPSGNPNVIVGQTSRSWIVSLDSTNMSPGETVEFTFGLSVGSAAFDPASVTLSASNPTSSFAFTPNVPIASFVAGPALAGSITTNALNYDVTNLPVTVQGRTISIGTFTAPYVNVPSASIAVSVAQPPPAGSTLTLQPVATNATFTPSIITFTPTTTQVNVFYTASYPISTTLQWILTDTTGYYLQPGNSTLTANKNMIGVTSPPSSVSYYVSQPTQAYVLTLSAPVQSSLSINITSSNTLATIVGGNILSFSAGQTSASFTAVSSNIVNAVFSFALFGPDAIFFSAPTSTQQASWNPIPLSATYTPNFACGSSAIVTVTAAYPLPNGITITGSIDNSVAPSAAASISPSAPVNIAAGQTSAVFTVSDISSGNDKVQFNVYGADLAVIINNLFTPSLAFSQGAVSFTAASISVYPGSTAQYTATIGALPQSDITITPVASSGLTFTPASITFTPTSTSLTQVFSLAVPAGQSTASGANTISVSYQITGTNAQCFSGSTTTSTLTVIQMSGTTTPNSQNIGYNTLAQYQPQGASYTLSIPNLQSALTVTLSAQTSAGVPYPAVFSPSTLTFSATQTSQTYTVFASASTSGPIAIIYSKSGAAAGVIAPSVNLDSPLFALNAVPLTVTAPSNLQVGQAATVTVALNYTTPSDLTVILKASDSSVVSPTVLTFTAVGQQLVATYTVTPVKAGTVAVFYMLSGTDTYMYNTPNPTSINFPGSSVALSYYGGTAGAVSIGLPFAFLLKATMLPSTPLTLTMTGPFTFSPNPITLNGLTATGTATPLETIPVGNGIPAPQISFIVAGALAPFYTNSSLSVTLQTPTVTVACPSGQQIVIGQPSQVCTVTLQQFPTTDLTITLSSNNAIINPSTFTFTSTSTSTIQTFSFLSTQTNDGSASVTINGVLSGTDAAYFQTPQTYVVSYTAVDPYKFTTVSTAPAGAGPFYGQSYSIAVTVAAVQNGVTITPQTATGHVTFSPASLTFTPGSSLVQTFTATATSYAATGSQLVVTYAISGPDTYLFTYHNMSNSLAYRSAPTTSLTYNQALVTTTLTSVNLNVGTTYSYYVTLQAVPVSGLTVQIIAPSGVTVTPTTLSWTPASPLNQMFTVLSNAAVPSSANAYIQLQYSGPSVQDFATTPAVTYKVTVNPVAATVLTPATFHASGQTKLLTVSLGVPVVSALTITPSSSGVSFTPTSVALTAGQTYAVFNATYTSTLPSSVVTYALSGADSTRFAPLNPTTLLLVLLSLNFAAVPNTVVFNQQQWEAYVNTGGFSAINYPFNVTITPSAPGFTFVPASSFVSQTQQSVIFTVVASAPSLSQVVTFAVTGADAVRFNPISLTTTITSPAPVTLSPATPQTKRAPIAAYVGQPITGVFNVLPAGLSALTPVNLPPTQIDLTSSVPGTFVQSSFVISGQTTTFSYTFTPTQTSGHELDIFYQLSGAGAIFFADEGYVTVASSVSSHTLDVAGPSTISNNVLYIGQTTDAFTVALKSPILDVTVTPVCDTLVFSPASFRLSGATPQASFTITPTAITSYIKVNVQYILSGPSANYISTASFAVFSSWLVSPNFNVTEIPALIARQPSPPVTLTMNPAPLVPTTVGLSVTGCTTDPASLLFSSGSNAASFAITCNSPTITGSASLGSPLTFTVTPSGGVAYTPRFAVGNNTKTEAVLVTSYGIHVPPGRIIMSHPRYQHTVTSDVSISISSQPQSDFSILLQSGNIEFNPPAVTFSKNGPTTIKIKATPKYASTADLDFAPTQITYTCSGVNYFEYVCPTQSGHFVSIQPGFVAAAVLAPIVFVIIAGVLFAVFRSRSGSYSSKGVDIALKSQ